MTILNDMIRRDSKGMMWRERKGGKISWRRVGVIIPSRRTLPRPAHVVQFDLITFSRVVLAISYMRVTPPQLVMYKNKKKKSPALNMRISTWLSKLINGRIRNVMFMISWCLFPRLLNADPYIPEKHTASALPGRMVMICTGVQEGQYDI